MEISPLVLCKKHQEKFMNEYETKWIYIHKGYEDNLSKDLFFQTETNVTGKLARWKHNINTPVDLKISGEQRRHVSSILYELKTKDTGIKSKKSRHLIQKGQKASEDEVEDEELDAILRLPVFKLPIYTSHSLKCAPGQKEKEQESFLQMVSHFLPFIKDQ
ncbi:Leucine-rich repeat and IQ domain-containing protein 3 [Manis javanica]|nr:Leucine-rich repeat and IQ domain-containing protein 3 [Manis javanica]